MLSPRIFSLLLISSCFPGLVHAASAPIDLVDQNGAVLRAQLVSSDGQNLTITRQSDQKTFTIPLNKLDTASQAAVKKWVDEGGNLSDKFEITVGTGKTSRTTINDDFDDKRVNMSPTITLRNPDPKLACQAGKITVLFLGRPVADSSGIYVFKKASFDLPSLATLASMSFSVPAFSAAYDDRGYAKFGARYTGYVLLIHEPDGSRIITAMSIPAPLVATNPSGWLKLKENQTYTKDLKPSVTH